MAVYTKVNKKDIVSINNQFEMEKITYFKGIKKGIENTNYLLKTKKNKFILTIFEKRVLDKEIPFFMKLMELLNTHKINCPKPLKSKKKKPIIKYCIIFCWSACGPFALFGCIIFCCAYIDSAINIGRAQT